MVCTDLPCSAARVLHLASIFGWKTSEKAGKAWWVEGQHPRPTSDSDVQKSLARANLIATPNRIQKRIKKVKSCKIHSCELKLFCIFLRLAITLKCPCCFYLWYCCCPVPRLPSSLPRQVQIGRSHMTATQIKYWKDFPEVWIEGGKSNL